MRDGWQLRSTSLRTGYNQVAAATAPRTQKRSSHDSCSFVSIETRSAPALTHVLPLISTFRFSHLCRPPPGGSIHSLLPSQLLR